MRDFLAESDAEGDSNEIDLTPMLDVVFIMLIFFIVTASFVKEAGFDVNRPPSTQQPPPENSDIKNILVSIDADGRLYVNRRPVDAGALTANIKRLHAESPKGSVVIQADTDARAGLMVEAMDQARLAGVKDVSIAALPR